MAQHGMNGGLTGAHIVTAAPAPQRIMYWVPHIFQCSIYACRRIIFYFIIPDLSKEYSCLHKAVVWSCRKREGNSFSEGLGGGWDLMPSQNPVLNALYQLANDPGSACGVGRTEKRGGLVLVGKN